MGKILYAVHVELCALLQALPAASPICAKPADYIQGTISLNCCHMTVALSAIQHGFQVALASA